jgi:hypothetical protein
MSHALEDMRGMLAEQGAHVEYVELLAEAPPELLGHILQYAPEANGLVARTSEGMRRRFETLVPFPPLWFHVLSNQYPTVTESQRCESMLTELETQDRWFRLFSIEMPGFVLDDPNRALTPLPFLTTERGAVRLAAVLDQRCAALECLDLTHTSIEQWCEIGAARPSCVALQRVKLTGSVFTRDNNLFGGLAQCAALRELVIEETNMEHRLCSWRRCWLCVRHSRS